MLPSCQLLEVEEQDAMPKANVYEDENATEPLFVADFDFLPRVGETISKDAGDYYSYYDVVEVWHTQDFETGEFRACLLVKLDD